jgi:hypothetical protein
MSSTGTITFMPRSAVPAAVNSTAPFEAVPVAMTDLEKIFKDKGIQTGVEELTGLERTLGVIGGA